MSNFPRPLERAQKSRWPGVFTWVDYMETLSVTPVDNSVDKITLDNASTFMLYYVYNEETNEKTRTA